LANFIIKRQRILYASPPRMKILSFLNWKIIKEIKRVISEEELPSPTPYELRCQDCCYFAVCRRD